jgi:hypothetical protein
MEPSVDILDNILTEGLSHRNVTYTSQCSLNKYMCILTAVSFCY